MNAPLSLEAFEARVVPTAIVKFTEVDGDKITVRTNQGTTAQLEDAIGFTNGATAIDGFTVILNETAELATVFAGTNLKITAKGPGNQQADKVQINDSVFYPNLIDLGNISVKGNLIYCDAGDADLSTPAIKKITVTSWGPQTFTAFSIPSSTIFGDIGAVVVKESFNSNIISVDANRNPNYQTAEGVFIGSFTCKNFASVSGLYSGFLQVNGIGKLTIKETFSGDAANTPNGLIQAVTIDKITIKHMAGDAAIDMG